MRRGHVPNIIRKRNIEGHRRTNGFVIADLMDVMQLQRLLPEQIVIFVHIKVFCICK
jgi:hypothetical protein